MIRFVVTVHIVSESVIRNTISSCAGARSMTGISVMLRLCAVGARTGRRNGRASDEHTDKRYDNA